LKKRKLNSKNPKYLPEKKEKKVKEKRLIVDLLFAQIYAVFYENV
jgi:hypothetical protein